MVDDYNASLVRLLAGLEKSGIPYALGGAGAVAVWGIPRATADIDVTVWCEPAQNAEILAALEAMGVQLDMERALHEVNEQGVVYARWEGIRLDVFFPSIPFYEDVLAQRVRLTLPGLGPTWVLSAESLVVFKLLFFRGKDLRDVEAIVSVYRELDCDYVRRVLVEMVGEGDARVAEWDRIVSA